MTCYWGGGTSDAMSAGGKLGRIAVLGEGG